MAATHRSIILAFVCCAWIQPMKPPWASVLPSRIIDSQPKHLTDMLHQLLGDALSLTPIHIPNQTGP